MDVISIKNNKNLNLDEETIDLLDSILEYEELHFVADTDKEFHYGTNDSILFCTETGEKVTYIIRHIMDVTITKKGVFISALGERVNTPEPDVKETVVNFESYKNKRLQ